MKKLFLISSVLFAMVIGFAGCDSETKDIAGTKWDYKIAAVGGLASSTERIYFEKNGDFRVTSVSKAVSISAEVPMPYSGTYEYENGNGKLFVDTHDVREFTVSGKKLTLDKSFTLGLIVQCIIKNNHA